MAKKTNKRAKSAAPYLQRLVDDEYIHEHLQLAATRLREAYRRASRQRGQAVEDKKLYGNLREAATSLRNATLALQRRRPEPKRRGRKAVLVALAGGTAAIVLRRRARERAQRASSGEPVASATTDAGRATEPAGTPASEQAEPAPQAAS